MQKFFKYIKIILLSALGLLALVVFIAIFGEDMANGWRKMLYSHPNQVAGITLGDEKKDLVFKLGKGITSENTIHYKNIDTTFFISSSGKVTTIDFRPGELTTKYTFRTFPIRTVEDLKDKFGEPDIYSSSKDQLRRRYTYSSDNLSTGTTYNFIQNRISDVMIGEITWRSSSHLGQGDYIVNGTIFCPGEKCPMIGKDFKPEWKNKSVRDLVANK